MLKIPPIPLPLLLKINDHWDPISFFVGLSQTAPLSPPWIQEREAENKKKGLYKSLQFVMHQLNLQVKGERGWERRCGNRYLDISNLAKKELI